MLIEPPRLRPSPATKQAAHVRVHQALHIKPVWLRLLLELLLLTVLVELPTLFRSVKRPKRADKSMSLNRRC
jgi:hypothetical protein